MKGFSKKLNKANQYVIEKLGSVKGTELDEEFIKMEKNCQIFGSMINEITDRMENCLHISTMGPLSLLSRNRGGRYPERILSETCAKYGSELSHCHHYASALVSFGETMKLQSSYREQMDETIMQEFLEPLSQFHSKELKEINHHNKKMVSRRLDYDCKKRKNIKSSTDANSEELEEAQSKFDESRELCATAMTAFLMNDLEKINQLRACVNAFSNFYTNSLENFSHLIEALDQITERAIADEQTIKTNSESIDNCDIPSKIGMDGSNPFGSSFHLPWARSLYTFVAQNDDELSFPMGVRIELISKADDNWFFGSVDGVSGYFPVSYVDVIVPISN